MTDPIVYRVAARFAAEVVQLRPRATGPKLQIGGKHYALSTDSGPLMGDLADEMAPPPEGGARIIPPDPHANKWRYLWAYDTDNQVLAMWRVSDGDEKVYENAKHAGGHIIRLDKKGQLNRVDAAGFRAIDQHMRRRAHETIEDLKKVVEQNKSTDERQLDEHVRAYFDGHVAKLIEHAISDIQRGATPIGFKPHDPKAEHTSLERQATVYVIGRIIKKEMTIQRVEAYLRDHGFNPESVHNQAIEWAVGDVQDAAFETYLPPR